jgi:serine/threonine protein kinase
VAPVSDIFGLTGATLDGKYAIERPVAAGAFGVVYRAEHTALRRPAAIKVLKLPDTLSDAAQRAIVDLFEREAQTIARLDHPAVVRVIDYGVSAMHDGLVAPWMALEWLDGVTLDRHLDHLGRSPIAPAEALALLRPAFEALALAHARGIAHRDLKPANLMCVPDWRGDTTLRVLDFGIARVMAPDEVAGSGETLTQAALAPFSPAYGAPEQVAHARTGPWTDVHGLALLLVELLVGRRPYPPGDVTALCAAALSPARPTPARFGVDVGPLEPVLLRALALRPADRFADAGSFLAAVDAALAPPVAPPRPRRGVPWPHVAAAVAGVALLTAAAFAASASLRDPAPTVAPTPVATPLRSAPLPTPPAVATAPIAPPEPTAVAALAAPPSAHAAPTAPTRRRSRHARDAAPPSPSAPATPARVEPAPAPPPCIGARCRVIPE